MAKDGNKCSVCVENLETSEMPFADLFAKETEEDIPALDNFLGHGLRQPVKHLHLCAFLCVCCVK